MEMILFFALIGAVLSFMSGKLKEKRGSSEKYQKILGDFYGSVARQLQPGECVEAYCGYMPCAAVTNRRLVISDKQGMKSVPFYQIRKVKGMDYSGNKTYDPKRMLCFEIKADKKYVLGNHSEGFDQVVTALYRHMPGV